MSLLKVGNQSKSFAVSPFNQYYFNQNALQISSADSDGICSGH